MALLNVVLTSAGAPIVAALAVALVFNPLHVRLQRRVEVAMYGTLRDPIKASTVRVSPPTSELVLAQRSDEPVRETRRDNVPGHHIWLADVGPLHIVRND